MTTLTRTTRHADGLEQLNHALDRIMAARTTTAKLTTTATVAQDTPPARTDAELLQDACRLTDELCDQHWFNRGVQHSTVEIAAIAIGYWLELKGEATR